MPGGSGPNHVRLYVGGEWRDAMSGQTHTKRSPWSGSELFTVESGDDLDTASAIDAAASAFTSWADAMPGTRQMIFLRAAEILERRRVEVVDMLALETGCTAHFATVQVDFAQSLLRQCSALPYAPVGTVLPSEDPSTRATALRRPVGVVAAVAPWNASLILSGRSICGPIALANTVVLKPSEESPFTGGTLWAEIFEEAGLPPGVLNVVTHGMGGASVVTEAMITHPAVRRLNFTGSTAVGRRLAESAGRNLKRMVLQLSGQNPLLVLEGVDLTYAVDAAAYGAFVHQGQVCMCARRIYVERSIAGEFIERFAQKVDSLPTGDPQSPSTVIGPLVNEWALSLVSRRVEEAVNAGARLLAGGRADGPCYRATALTDVPADTELAFDETFGPVVLVEVVDDVDEAVARANSSGFGLTAAVLAADAATGLGVARRIEAGIVHVNDQPVNDEPQMPFGGVKDSGWGRFGVGFTAEEFTDLQWVSARGTQRIFPF